MNRQSTVDTDIVIVGAGPVGMALALALAGSRHRVLLIDRRPRGAWIGDPRVLAISYGSRQLLGRLKAWESATATGINEVHVSQRGGFGSTRLLASDYRIPALGYVMRYRDLAAALDVCLPTDSLIDNAVVTQRTVHPDEVTLTLTRGADEVRIRARLIVHAEGTPGEDEAVSVFDYGQTAVIAEVTPAAPHAGRAWERFTPDGPLALLPIGNDYAVVFTRPHDAARQLTTLDDSGFLDALRAQSGPHADFIHAGPRASYPLALRVRRNIVQARQAWIGNSAQALHPVTGQGFNLGLRDAWELAEHLHRTADPGDATALARFARRRRLDRIGTAGFTDGLVRMFSNDLAPLRIARGLGLLALDLAPPLRDLVARRMIWGARAWP